MNKYQLLYPSIDRTKDSTNPEHAYYDLHKGIKQSIIMAVAAGIAI